MPAGAGLGHERLHQDWMRHVAVDLPPVADGRSARAPSRSRRVSEPGSLGLYGLAGAVNSKDDS